MRELMDPHSDLALGAQSIADKYFAILPGCANGSAYQILNRTAMGDRLHPNGARILGNCLKYGTDVLAGVIQIRQTGTDSISAEVHHAMHEIEIGSRLGPRREGLREIQQLFVAQTGNSVVFGFNRG